MPNKARMPSAGKMNFFEMYVAEQALKNFDLSSVDYPISIYFVASKIIKIVQSNLRTREDLAYKDRANLLFYMAMHVSICLLEKLTPSSEELASIETETITDNILNSSFESVKSIYDELGATDTVAKGPYLLTRMKQSLAERFQNFTNVV
jgi:hypothetical protein